MNKLNVHFDHIKNYVQILDGKISADSGAKEVARSHDVIIFSKRFNINCKNLNATLSAQHDNIGASIISAMKCAVDSDADDAGNLGDSDSSMRGCHLMTMPLKSSSQNAVSKKVTLFQYDDQEYASCQKLCATGDCNSDDVQSAFNSFRLSARNLGADIFNYVKGQKVESLNIILIDDLAITGSSCGCSSHAIGAAASEIAFGIEMRRYTFDKYYNAKSEDHAVRLNHVNFYLGERVETDAVASDADAVDRAKDTFISCCGCVKSAADLDSAMIARTKFEEELAPVIAGNIAARDLVNEPGNMLYPEAFADACVKLSENSEIKVRILDHIEMEKLGMGAFVAVEKGSDRRGRMVIMEWNGDKSSDRFIGLVGKGVTFDTGGINLKGTAHIADMKYDMAGAAAVYGAMKAIAERKARANVVAVLACAENMPSGHATRPGDIVTSMSGQTIEIDNTDAEGRLVLSDSISYVQSQYNLKSIVDLATLTGAITVALGDLYAGLFANDNSLAQELIKAGDIVGERLWQLPISKPGKDYDTQIDSKCADIRNVGQSGRGAGSITAAQFLQRFVKNDCPWAHIDIAGVAWNKFGASKLCQDGPTGFGVMLLNEWVRAQEAQKGNLEA